MKLTFDRAIIVYWLIALLTFGYVASGSQRNCSLYSDTECRALSGILSGLVWPLYWTWEAFDAGRAAMAQGGE